MIKTNTIARDAAPGSVIAAQAAYIARGPRAASLDVVSPSLPPPARVPTLVLHALVSPIMRYAVLVTGPAGAGKSTFCGALMTHLQTARRTGHLVNLDPAAAASSFEYEPAIDIKDLVSLDDVMTELGYGPNGGLVYCFE